MRLCSVLVAFSMLYGGWRYVFRTVEDVAAATQSWQRDWEFEYWIRYCGQLQADAANRREAIRLAQTLWPDIPVEVLARAEQEPEPCAHADIAAQVAIHREGQYGTEYWREINWVAAWQAL